MRGAEDTPGGGPGGRHHHATVRGANRADRNMLPTVTGDFARLDKTTWQHLQQALTAA
jgi:hypothetical protein